jgi:hypothetical protein
MTAERRFVRQATEEEFLDLLDEVDLRTLPFEEAYRFTVLDGRRVMMLRLRDVDLDLLEAFAAIHERARRR